MNLMTIKFKLADQIRETLFLQVQKSMKAQNISQGEVARRTGTARTNINRLMCRKIPVSIDFLLMIAESIDLEAELKTRLRK